MKGSREEGNVLVEKQHSNTGNSVLEIEKTKQNQPNKKKPKQNKQSKEEDLLIIFKI